MRSSNPVFAQSEVFGNGGSSLSLGESRVSIESVIEKTAIMLFLVALTASITWFALGDFGVSSQASRTLVITGAASGILGFILSLVISFQKEIRPALVVAYSLVEGVFIGFLSKLLTSFIGDGALVFQAIMATMIAFAATLAVYRFFDIKVMPKFRRFVTIAAFSFVGVIIVNFVLTLTGVFEQGGLRSLSGLGLIVSVFAVGLAILCLILDFDYIESSVDAGLPERESWRCAFGLVVTLVWMYIEILRILTILRGSS